MILSIPVDKTHCHFQFFKQDQSADKMQGFSPSLYIKYKALADFQDNAERDVGISRSDMQKLHSTFTSLIEHELEKGDFAMHSWMQRPIRAQLRNLSHERML